MRYTAYNIVRQIYKLPTNVNYNYINPGTSGLIHIESVRLPDGPIFIRRWDSGKGQTYANAKIQSISSEMIWRVANAVHENEPMNIDRILGASYNTRSVLETLMALTPEFYICYPGRIIDINGRSCIVQGHKHLIWLPNEPHQAGILVTKDVSNMAVSEISTKSVTYDSLVLPDNMIGSGDLDIEAIRRHTQIQIALYLIGLQLGYRTWIAQNDRGVMYKDRHFLEYPNMVQSLDAENLIRAFPNAEQYAKFIDCIWFQNHRFIPAVMEVEHTTGITSGLTRMKGLQDAMPSLNTRYVIVSADNEREKVIAEANRHQFVSLDARFFPYSSVEELYYICTHRNLHGVTQDFLDCYMEKICLQNI